MDGLEKHAARFVKFLVVVIITTGGLSTGTAFAAKKESGDNRMSCYDVCTSKKTWVRGKQISPCVERCERLRGAGYR